MARTLRKMTFVVEWRNNDTTPTTSSLHWEVGDDADALLSASGTIDVSGLPDLKSLYDSCRSSLGTKSVVSVK